MKIFASFIQTSVSLSSMKTVDMLSACLLFLRAYCEDVSLDGSKFLQRLGAKTTWTGIFG